MVNLKDMKDYLRVDSNEEDTLIQEFINAAEIYIEECCGTAYKNKENKMKLADLLTKKLVADMYSFREGTIDKQLQDRKVTTILELLSSGE